jgi:hypothetical protein
VDGGNVLGSASASLTLLTVSYSDGANYDVVISNDVASVTSSVAVLTVNIKPAKATPIIVNGFVIGAVITDPGCGYTNSPSVFLSGQGGSGATGYGQVSNGSITNIVMVSAGASYPADTTLVVAPPVFPRLSIALTNAPPATAIPIITNGFIVAAYLTATGSGYKTAPTVSFSDANGRGASAYAQISNGSVTNIVVTSAGSGYSPSTVAQISPPPRFGVAIPSAQDLLAGQVYGLQIANRIGHWINYGLSFTATNGSWTPPAYWDVTATNAVFFRLQMQQMQ